MLKRFCLAVTVLAFSLSPASALSILFDYTYDTGNFFTQDKRNTLNAAGLWFGSHLADNLTAITPSGSNSWSQTFDNPTTGLGTIRDDPSIPANTIVIYVGAADLPSSMLGEGGPGGYSAGGNAAWVDTVIARGQIGGTLNPETDFGPWGGTITFDLMTTWYIDQDTSTDEPFTGYDLYSVALHEIAHVLGFGTSGSFYGLIDSKNAVFKGATATSVFGANPPLADGAHLREGIKSVVFGTSIVQEAAMDPSLGFGARKRMTNLDMAVLSDVGWTVVPEPSTAGMLTLGALTLIAGRRRSSTSR